MQSIAMPDGSLVITPITPEQVSAICTAINVEGPEDAPSYDGRFVLTVPAKYASAAREAAKAMSKKG